MASQIPTSAEYIIVGGVLQVALSNHASARAIRICQSSSSKPSQLSRPSSESSHYRTPCLLRNTLFKPQLRFFYRPTAALEQPFMLCRYAAATKVLSGGSVINYGAWTRGPAAYFEHWAREVDDSRWSYEGLLPYFKKSEAAGKIAGSLAELLGFDGPIHTV